MISDYNRRIKINQYYESQDDRGGNIKALINQYEIWASVKALNGSKSLDSLAVNYSQSYQIKTRYEKSRSIRPNDEIVYEGKTLVIHNIIPIDEGNKRENKILAYTTNQTDNGLTATPITIVQEPYHFTGSGGEYLIHDDSLIGYSMIAVFRDGIEYRVVSSEPTGKQVQYNPVTGYLYFDTTQEAIKEGEQVDIYKIK